MPEHDDRRARCAMNPTIPDAAGTVDEQASAAGWTVHTGVTCVECPGCAFTFAADHEDHPHGGFSCPNCGHPDQSPHPRRTPAVDHHRDIPQHPPACSGIPPTTAVVDAAPGTVAALTAEMRANSERWFPATHASANPVPVTVFLALGLAGEAGEVANVVKKLLRDGDDQNLRADLGLELADVLTYLLLLADECGVDLVDMYRIKTTLNERRWGSNWSS
jgi:NTP pyrophosphatase (non-canonical NTP hydrolase)